MTALSPRGEGGDARFLSNVHKPNFQSHVRDQCPWWWDWEAGGEVELTCSTKTSAPRQMQVSLYQRKLFKETFY